MTAGRQETCHLSEYMPSTLNDLQSYLHFYQKLVTRSVHKYSSAQEQSISTMHFTLRSKGHFHYNIMVGTTHIFIGDVKNLSIRRH